MTPSGTQEIANTFTRKLEDRLDAEKLEGPVRLDNTRTVVIIPVKGKGNVHAHIQGVDDGGVENVINQIRSVPSLAGLVKQS